MNITSVHLAYAFVWAISVIVFFAKMKLLHKHAYISRVRNFTYKALSMSLISNVLFVLCCAWFNDNEDMTRISLVILIAILFDVNYYLYCKKRAARYRDSSFHDITNDIQIK